MRAIRLAVLATLALPSCALANAQTVFADARREAALPPVTVEMLRPLLDQDLAPALKSGPLAPGTDAGVVVGVVQHGVRRILPYGTANQDSIFEIGSITKTFTGLLLAEMIEQGQVRIDEPVRTLLPPGIVPKPPGQEITLLDLTTQHSGLPSNPDNLHPADPANPFADYSSIDLYAFLVARDVAHLAETPYGYSNTGVKLLAQALSVRAGLPYAALLQQGITDPLGMHDTTIALTPALSGRVLQGHDAQHHPVEAWTFSDLPGAGAIHSTAGDMLTYLDAQLHPERVPAVGRAKSLPAAIALSQQIRATANPGMHIAMNWFHSDADGSYQHGGRTGGFIAYAIFNPQQDFGIIVLSNTAGSQESLAVRLANRVAQRLTGLPAISLAEQRH